MVEPIDDAYAHPGNFGQARHVDVVELPVHVFGFHQCDLAVVCGDIGMIRKLTAGDEPCQKLPNNGFGGVVVGEPIQVGNRCECLHETPPETS